jgi:hypothetical protein
MHPGILFSANGKLLDSCITAELCTTEKTQTKPLTSDLNFTPFLNKSKSEYERQQPEL